jgi:quercetin dioxygenase-like cupin family protein
LTDTLGDFFTAAANAEGGLIVRATQRPAIGCLWSNAEIEALSAMTPGRRLEPMLVTLRPEARSRKHPCAHSGEVAYVIEGRVTLTLGPERHSLSAGDSVTILPGELRLWETPNTDPPRVLIVLMREESSPEAPNLRPRDGFIRERQRTAWWPSRYTSFFNERAR